MVQEKKSQSILIILKTNHHKRTITNVPPSVKRTQKAYSDPMKTTAERERDIHGGSTPSSDFWSGAAGGNWSASKGGLAKSKAKPKRMKKGGLASKKKK